MTDAVPDVAEPLLGFRGWYVDGLWLTSPSYRIAWPADGPLKAVCGTHAAPDERCSCGIYGVDRPGAAYGDVIGLVYGWGKVIPGTAGFRAEVARPAALFGDEGDRGLRRLAARYRVPILPPITPETYRTDVQLLPAPDEPFEEPGPYQPWVTRQLPWAAHPAHPRLVVGGTVDRDGKQWTVAETKRSSVTADGGEYLHVRLAADGSEDIWIRSIHSI